MKLINLFFFLVGFYFFENKSFGMQNNTIVIDLTDDNDMSTPENKEPEKTEEEKKLCTTLINLLDD